MNLEIDKLLKKFSKIKQKGWIKSINNNSNGIGLTFENLIDKKADDFFLPDFNGIEIKTKHLFCKGYISLFNFTPDGDYLFPIKYLKEKYGYPDKKIPYEKVFQTSISNFEKCIINKKYFRINVDYKNEKIVLKIIDNKSIDTSVSWSFKYLKERLYTKLNYLAIVTANSKHIENREYFYYYDIKIYRLKDFYTFLHLLELGVIRITFKIGLYHSGKKYGQTCDHGTSFEIHRNDISKLFDRIY